MMKHPKTPTKPWPPYKPSPPAKQVEERTKLGDLTRQEDGEFSVQWFHDYIGQTFPTVEPSTVKFSMEVNTEHGYYDEVSTHLDIHFYTVGMVDNPNYDRMFKYYEKQLAKYEKDYEKYKSDLEQYKLDEKQYKKDIELWRLEHAKSIIAKHEKKGKKK